MRFPLNGCYSYENENSEEPTQKDLLQGIQKF